MNRDLIAAASPLCWSMEPRAWHSMFAASVPRTAPAGNQKPENRDGVLTVPLCGVIWRNPPPIARLFLHVCDPDELAETIAAAQSDSSVESIVLRVDSPGGTIGGVPEAASAVAQSAKPLTATVTGTCASAALWIVAGADRIEARPSSSVGSIGCYSVFADSSRMLELAGVRLDVFRSSELKSTGLAGTALSAAQKEYLQSGVTELADMFADHVKACRPRAKAEAFNGGSFLGAKALALGLVDSVAGGGEVPIRPHKEKRPGDPLRKPDRVGAAVVEEDCGHGIRRFRLEQPDVAAERERLGAELVASGRARISRTGGVSSWRREDFEDQNHN